MAMRSRDVYISALDIGSTRISAAIGHLSPDEPLEILGVARVASGGLRNGVIVDLDETSATIQSCVDEVERLAQTRMGRALVSINGRGLKSFNSSGSLSLGQSPVSITDSHQEKCLEAAKNVTLSHGLDPVHYVIRQCLVDNTHEVDNPLRMMATRLEIGLHILALPRTQMTHFVKAANQAGVLVEKLVLQSLAAAEAVLLPEEKEFGTLFLDISASCTTGLIYQKGKIQHSFSIPVGGDNFTRDILVGLRTTLPEAERVKRENGLPDPASPDGHETIEIGTAGAGQTREISRQILAEILQPRAEEILEMVRTEMDMAGFDSSQFTSTVLCGGGALLERLLAFTENFLDIPCRLGTPPLPEGWPGELESPLFATLAGLLFKGRMAHTRRDLSAAEKLAHTPGLVQKTTSRFKSWFQELV